MVSKLKTTLATVDFVAITSDGFTALTTESSVTKTCHFIADGKVNSYVLQTRSLEERHSPANLADHLMTSVEQWGLDGKVVLCVHDYASNMIDNYLLLCSLVYVRAILNYLLGVFSQTNLNCELIKQINRHIMY